MKIIEAMKRIKLNEEKISDLHKRIADSSANLSPETPVYGDQTKSKLLEFAQSCEDIVQDNIKLLCSIQKTNLQTPVTIELGGKRVTKSIAEWVWRRRKYAGVDFTTWSKFTDRNLEKFVGKVPSSTPTSVEISLIRQYDVEARDSKLDLYKSEKYLIDSNLEIVNALTDLIE